MEDVYVALRLLFFFDTKSGQPFKPPLQTQIRKSIATDLNPDRRKLGCHSPSLVVDNHGSAHIPPIQNNLAGVPRAHSLEALLKITIRVVMRDHGRDIQT